MVTEEASSKQKRGSRQQPPDAKKKREMSDKKSTRQLRLAPRPLTFEAEAERRFVRLAEALDANRRSNRRCAVTTTRGLIGRDGGNSERRAVFLDKE